jgi:MATH domain/Ankyrin repeats (3 copies)
MMRWRSLASSSEEEAEASGTMSKQQQQQQQQQQEGETNSGEETPVSSAVNDSDNNYGVSSSLDTAETAVTPGEGTSFFFGASSNTDQQQQLQQQQQQDQNSAHNEMQTPKQQGQHHNSAVTDHILAPDLEAPDNTADTSAESEVTNRAQENLTSAGGKRKSKKRSKQALDDGDGYNINNNGSNEEEDGGDHAEEDQMPRIPWKPQNVTSTCEFTHTILDYSQKRESGCKKAEYSAITQDDLGNRWRLIIYVNGNGRASNHHLSLFLQVADAEDLPFGWKKSVSYVLTLEHPTSSQLAYAKRNPDKTFKLCPKAIDWGWSQFITSDRIQQDGFVYKDTLTVRAQVTVKSSSVAIDEEDAELYLKCAVEEGDAHSVKLCLEQGASVNCQFKDDLYTPLHTACSSGTTTGSMEVLELLLQQGADGNACNKWKESPLLIAANNGHRAAVETLLKHGANPSLCSEAGWSALTFAAHKVLFSQCLDSVHHFASVLLSI